MSVGSPHRTNHSRSRSTSRASSRGSSTKSPVYNVGPAPRPKTNSSSSLSPPPSSYTGRQSHRTTSANSAYGSGSSSRSSSRVNRALYSDVDPTDLDAVLVRAAGEEPHRVIELLDKGADPHARSKRLRLTFMHRLVSNPKVQPELLNRIIRHLDEEDVKPLVTAGNNFNITPLHFAINQNLETAPKIVEILLNHGADPGAIEGNELKRQPLHVAALKGNKGCIEALLKYKEKLDLDYRDSGESTALDNACWQGHMEVVKLLYEAGSGIHIRDDHGWTPLRSAAQYGHDEIVKYLIDQGADIGSADNEGLTSLHAASRDREITVVETLLSRGAYVNARDMYGCTPLDLVAWKGHEDVATILVNNGAAVEVCDYEGLTPVMTASEFGSEQLVHFLIAHGGDIHRKDLKGNTALDKTNLKHGRIIHFLIMKGAYSDIATEEGNKTPLMACIERGYKDAVEILVQKGADLQKRDSTGSTPLMKAACVGAIEIIEYLLNNYLEKVDIDSQNNFGKTALAEAVGTGREEVVDLLLQRKAKVDLAEDGGFTALHIAASFGMSSIAALLLEHKSAVDAVDDDQETPFSVLCRDPPDLELKSSYTLDAEDEGVAMPWVEERKPIVFRRYEETMNLLLKAGANPNWMNKNNDRPLHHAAKRNELGRILLLADLLPPDALYLQNSQEVTPLNLALSHKNPLTARLLLDRMTVADLGPDLDVDHEHKYLIWAAGSLETHAIALLLFAKSMKYDFDPNRKDWCAMDWAAYRAMPEVLWALLCSVEDTPETTRQRKSAMRIAKGLRQAAGLGNKRPPQKSPAANVEVKERHRARARVGDPGKKGAKPREPRDGSAEPVGPVDYEYEEQPHSPIELSPVGKGPNMEEGWPTLTLDDPDAPTSKKQKSGKHQDPNEERGQKGYKDDKWGLIVDMLRDPPIIQTSGPKEPFEAPTGDGQATATLEEKEAAIVDFYAGGGGTGFLRRFRSLQETIYEDGPHEIMKQARETMQHVSSEMNDDDDESRIEQQKTYTKKDLQFTWIHLPANNMKWMNDLLLRLCVDDEQHSENTYRELNSFMRKSWNQTPDRVSKTRFMRPQCVMDNSELRTSVGGNHREASIRSPMALYIPYLTFSKEYKHSVYSEERVNYQNLLEEYHESVIHGSRTLDEFYYHFSSEDRFEEDMRRRNLDQVVTKEIDGDLAERSHFTAVRVDQIWLWMVDNKTLITSSTHRIDGDDDPFFTGIIDLLTKGTERSKARFAQPRDALEMSQIIVNFCVGCFDRQPKFRPHEKTTMLMHGSVRQIFSDSINKTAIEEADLFRRYTQEQIAGDNGQKPKNKRRREAVGTAAELFRRIKDIRDELNILKALAETQDGVQSALMYYRDRDIQKARSVVKDIIELDEIAKRLQNSISTTLSLEQNDTAITQSQESVRQGRTLMVFTMVTLLFLPMSFLTSFFALDAESFLNTPAWAFIIIFCVSMGLVIPLASYAFYSETISEWVYKKWPGKTDNVPAQGEPAPPLVQSSAASQRTNKALSILNEKNDDYPTIRVDEVIKGIDRQRTSEFKWPVRRRDTRKASDVDAIELDRRSIASRQ